MEILPRLPNHQLTKLVKTIMKTNACKWYCRQNSWTILELLDNLQAAQFQDLLKVKMVKLRSKKEVKFKIRRDLSNWLNLRSKRSKTKVKTIEKQLHKLPLSMIQQESILVSKKIEFKYFYFPFWCFVSCYEFLFLNQNKIPLIYFISK